MFELKLFYTPIFLFGFYSYGYDIMRHPLVRNYSWIIDLMTVMFLFETHHKNEAILFYWVQSDSYIIQRVFILILLTKFKLSYRTLMIYSTFCAFLRNSLFLLKKESWLSIFETKQMSLSFFKGNQSQHSSCWCIFSD